MREEGEVKDEEEDEEEEDDKRKRETERNRDQEGWRWRVRRKGRGERKTYYMPIEPPLIPQHLIEEEVVSTTWHSVHLIVTAHHTGNTSILNTHLKCWQICLVCVCEVKVDIKHTSFE